ncbi:hypothetical protein BGY98DRAFT_970440 [Russula aff. rugulosa BPL654]|nr:hypothetical protein BGY98DRAFT_970440 [Russula aff. rugulosa BPL654]
MSETHQWSLTPSISSQGSAPSSSKFTEHLSIAVPPPNSAFERSRFSPDSPTRHAFPLGRHIFHRSSPRSQRFDPEKGAAIDSIPSSQSSQPSIRDRLARLFFILRVSRRNDSSVQRVAPIVVAPPSDVPVWRLGHVPESETQHARNVHPRPTRTQERYSPALLFAFMIFLLYLFINVIVLNIRSFSPSHSSLRLLPTTPPASAPTDPIMISADAQQCLTQYTLNAPNNPEGYPCSTCLPLLNAVPTNSSPVYPVARDATQFCGLRSIWEDAGQQGQAGLEAGGWVKDVKFCTWSGVRCNGAGRVSSLQLTFPAVPASLPAQFTNLTDLETIEVVGGGNTPAGLFPTDFGALTKLTTLHLENTALGALPDTLQHLTSLILVRNAQVGSSLPSSVGVAPFSPCRPPSSYVIPVSWLIVLFSSIVNNELLTLSAAQSAALCSRQLQNCDLRGTGIKACGACLVS